MKQEQYAFCWNSKIIDGDGQEYLEDQLERAKYASFLTNYLIEKGKSKEGYVLNINAVWGSGKTYFLKRWIHDLKQDHPTVYIDAWKQDYSDDPMLTVISSIIEQLKNQLPKSNQYIEKVTLKASKFMKVTSHAITKAMLKKAVGIDLSEISDTLENLKSEDNNGNFSEEIVSSITKSLISEHNKKLESVEHLRKELVEWVSATQALSENLNLPAFIFIDELDRCRPNYAIEMLEIIKHFFHVKNIVFVIATDTEQLQHAVKAVYGSNFDASTYLSRFFKRRFSLGDTPRGSFVQAYLSHISHLPSSAEKCWPSINGTTELCSGIANIADCFQLSLRETEQLCDKIYSIFVNTTKSFDFYFLCIMFVLHDKYYDIYIKWFNLSNNFHITSILEGINHDSPWHDNVYYSRIVIGSHFKKNELYQLHYDGINDYSSFPQRPFIYTRKISDILMDTKKYLNLSESEKASSINSIPIHTTSNEEHFERAQKHKLLIDIEAKEVDYRNWIELATSFE